jgi:hypothetical protein
MQVEQRRARRGERQARRESLQTAAHEEPDDRVGQHEEHRGQHQRPERNQQHGAATDLVGDAPREQEGSEYAECVSGVDEREDDG